MPRGAMAQARRWMDYSAHPMQPLPRGLSPAEKFIPRTSPFLLRYTAGEPIVGPQRRFTSSFSGFVDRINEEGPCHV